MAVYQVFSQCVQYRHKSTVCSSASLFIVLVSILVIVCPFFFVYRSNGFWLRTATYREQPEVHFKHAYILIVETSQFNEPIICSTFANLTAIKQDNGHCALVKSREVDKNDDGKFDELYTEFSLHIGSRKSVHGVKLLLLFDYILHTSISLQMESLGYIHYNSGLPGARYDVVADLHLVQRKALSTYGRDLKYNTSVISDLNLGLKTFNLGTVFKEYTERSVSTILSNIYSSWTTGLVTDTPFVLSVIIHYPEETLTYLPRFWQIVKWAWIQYVSVLLIFIYVFRSIKIYVFHNRLLPSIKDVPWKKSL